jgi:hypothetical protein
MIKLMVDRGKRQVLVSNLAQEECLETDLSVDSLKEGAFWYRSR